MLRSNYMQGYTKLFASIVTSTVWREPLHVKVLWVTMIAIKDKYGLVEASLPGLADLAKITREQCEDALRVLGSPDPDSRTKDLDGRRIVAVDGGWQVVNHQKYREKMSEDERRGRNAAYMRDYRSRNVTCNKPVLQPLHVSEVEHQIRSETDQTQIRGKIPDSAPRSAEPDSTPAVLEFPTAGKAKSWTLRELRVTEWGQAFPALDVTAECRKALAWVNASPARRKTATGMAKFLVNWLSRAQDRGRASGDLFTGKPDVSSETHAAAKRFLERHGGEM